jgi:regulation of enolase protein 1 (concanavalin A-like superfamily)
MQAANNTDFEIEVKFDTGVLERYQMQGIVIEQDEQNYVRFEFYGDGVNVHLFAAAIVSGSPSVISDFTLSDATTPLYLRVKRQGNQWTHSTSADGHTWSSAGSYQQALVVSQVGDLCR